MRADDASGIGASRAAAPASGVTDLALRQRWDDVLRSYADALDQHRALLLGVQPDDPDAAPVDVSFAPPDGLPPCPPELAPRLRALQQETTDLVELARSTLAALKPVGASHPHRPPAGDASASRMDTRL